MQTFHYSRCIVVDASIEKTMQQWAAQGWELVSANGWWTGGGNQGTVMHCLYWRKAPSPE